jgi:hypothetical protein
LLIVHTITCKTAQRSRIDRTLAENTKEKPRLAGAFTNQVGDLPIWTPTGLAGTQVGKDYLPPPNS